MVKSNENSEATGVGSSERHIKCGHDGADHSARKENGFDYAGTGRRRSSR